jgi:hypothetical protein
MSLREAPDEEILDESKHAALIQRACEPFLYKDFVTFGKREVESSTRPDGQVLMTVKMPFQGSPTYFSLWRTRDVSLGFEVGNGFVAKTYVFNDGFEKEAKDDVDHLKKLVGETIDAAKAMNDNFVGEIKNRLVMIHGPRSRQKQQLEKAEAAKRRMEE